MSAHTPEQIRQETRKYVLVFLALAVLTAITVGISYAPLSGGGHIFGAMLVAVIKGGLVAAYFMHLIGGRKTIYGILLLTVVCFVALMGLPSAWWADGPPASLARPSEHVAVEH